MNASYLREYVVRPALNSIGLYSVAAEILVMGTALHESAGLEYIDQLTPGPGPAYGFWQMEKATHDDLWKTFLPYHAGLNMLTRGLVSSRFKDTGTPPVTELHGNLPYAAAMCRVHYRRVPAKLPEADDLTGLATYAKRYYNTALGSATVDQYLSAMKRAANLPGV